MYTLSFQHPWFDSGGRPLLYVTSFALSPYFLSNSAVNFQIQAKCLKNLKRKDFGTTILSSLVRISLRVANTSLLITVGAASERAPEESCYRDHRLFPCLHVGRDSQLSPYHWPLLHPQLHQQVRSHDLLTWKWPFSLMASPNVLKEMPLHANACTFRSTPTNTFSLILYILDQTLFYRSFSAGEKDWKEIRSFYLLNSINESLEMWKQKLII